MIKTVVMLLQYFICSEYILRMMRPLKKEKNTLDSFCTDAQTDTSFFFAQMAV